MKFLMETNALRSYRESGKINFKKKVDRNSILLSLLKTNN